MTLYLDASGDYGWKPPSISTWYTMAGIILTETQHNNCTKRAKEILKKYIPDKLADSSLKHYELHYTDIIHGNNIFKEMNKEKRLNIVKDVFDLLLEINAPIIATSINKIQLCKCYKKPYHPMELVFRSLLHKLSMYCGNKKKNAGVVYDDEGITDYVNKIRLMQAWKKYGSTIQGREYDPIYKNQLEYVKELKFHSSYSDVGIQLADFIAGAVWQHRERNRIRDYNKLTTLWENHYIDTIVPAESRWK